MLLRNKEIKNFFSIVILKKKLNSMFSSVYYNETNLSEKI